MRVRIFLVRVEIRVVARSLACLSGLHTMRVSFSRGSNGKSRQNFRQKQRKKGQAATKNMALKSRLPRPVDPPNFPRTRIVFANGILQSQQILHENATIHWTNRCRNIQFKAHTIADRNAKQQRNSKRYSSNSSSFRGLRFRLLLLPCPVPARAEAIN